MQLLMLYAKCNDQYLIDNQLTKSTMKLVDEIEFQKLLSTLKIEANYLWWICCKFNCWAYRN